MVFDQFPLKPFHLSLKNWLGKLICQLLRFCGSTIQNRVKSVPDNFLGARSFCGAENTSTWTCRPPRCGNTSGSSSSPSTTASPRAEQRYRSGARRPTTKFDLKTLKDNKNNAEFHHEIGFKYFISSFQNCDCSEGANNLLIICLFHSVFFFYNSSSLTSTNGLC